MLEFLPPSPAFGMAATCLLQLALLVIGIRPRQVIRGAPTYLVMLLPRWGWPSLWGPPPVIGSQRTLPRGAAVRA